MSELPSAILIMCKIPYVTPCKTRMKPQLDDLQCAELQDALLKDTFDMVQTLPYSVYICYAPSEGKRYVVDQLGSPPAFEQTEGDLGVKMLSGIQTVMRKGYEKVIVIGGDIPTLQPAAIEQAIRALDAADVCVGPAKDGGYYLIGLKRECRELFVGIDWSTERVFRQTSEAAKKAGYEMAVLPEGLDLDQWEDALVFYEQREQIEWEKRPLRTERFIQKIMKMAMK